MINLDVSKYLSFSFIFIVVIILTGCRHTRTRTSEYFSLRIVAANVEWMQGDDESDAHISERLHESGKFISREMPFWSIIAANELSSDKTGGGSAPVRFRAKKLDCPYDDTDEKLLSINCLERGLRRLSDTKNLMHQKGELGIVASDMIFEQLPINENGDLYYTKLIGPERAGGIQRRLIASRFRQKRKDKNVLFVSTHLSHAGSSAERKEELKDLIRNIKEIFKPGDLTPILAGDFNCGSWKGGLRRIMHQDFIMALPGPGIPPGVDHVFVGRPQSFPGNGGVLLPKANSFVRRHPTDNQGNSLSDHGYTSADVEYDPDNQPTFLAPPITVSGEGCIKP